MPLYDSKGNAITEYLTSDGDSFQYRDSNGQWNTRLRLDYSSSETLKNTTMDDRGQIIYSDANDMKKKKEVDKLNSVLQGKAAFDNYKANAQQAKQVLESVIKNYNVTLNETGEQETSLGKYKTGNLIVDVNGKKIPLSSIMKNVGLGYSVDKKGVISGDQYLSEIKNGVTDVQSKMAKINEMFKSGDAQSRTEFSYVSGIPVSTAVTGNMIAERTKANDKYVKHGDQYIPQLAERLRKFDNIPGGEAILFKMKQNPNGYWYGSPAELEKAIEKDPIAVITKGLVYNQAAYAASIASDESNVVGTGRKDSADMSYMEGLSVLASGNRDAIAGFVDSIASFNPDGSVGTHNRKTHLDRNSFGNQLMTDKASQGKGMWAVDRFFDGMANGTIVGNIAKYFGVADNASLNESIMRDVLGSDSDGLLINAANITGNIAGMVTEAALMRKGAKVAGGGLSATQIAQMGNYSNVLQYGLHGTALPMLQAINEAEENPLWEQYIDKGWKESDFTKVLADGLQNVATMYVGNRVLEPIMGAMLKGQWLKKAMMVGKTLPANSDETIAKNLLNNIFANHVKYPALSLGSEILGDMGLDYASVKLTNDLFGMDGVEESLFTRSTTNALSNMFSEDMFARTLAQRFGARVFKNLSSRISDDVMTASGRKSKDEALMGEVKWYEQERAKNNQFNGTKKTMSSSEKFTVWMSNAMFGNSLKSLDLSSRFLDNGFIDEAKKMDQDRSDIETKMNTTLLRWMVQENTLNVASKMFYGHLVEGTKNNWFKDTWTDSNGEKISIKDLYKAFQAGATNDNEDIKAKVASIASAINVANKTGIDSESSAKINIKGDAKASDDVVGKILDSDSDVTSKRLFTRMLFSNANQDGFTNLKNSFERLSSDKIMNYKRDIESLKRASSGGVTDPRIKELENKIEDVETVVETIKNPNMKENFDRSFEEVSDDFFKITGFKRGESVSDDQAEIVLNSIKHTLNTKQNDTLWKLGLGNGLHSDEFKTLFMGLRNSFRNILADNSMGSKDKLNLLFDGFSSKANEIIDQTFKTFKDGIESTARKNNATEAEKLNAIRDLNSLKILINLAPFSSRQVYAKQIAGILSDDKVFNMILTTKLKGELEGATDKAKFVNDMRDNLMTEMLESASTLGAMREFMSVDTAAGKMENKAEIMRLFHSAIPSDRLKAVRMLKAFDEPANNINDEYFILDQKNSKYDEFVFPNLIDVIEIENSNDHVRIATNAMIGTAISRFEKKHYNEDSASNDEFNIHGNIISVSRNTSDKNNYEIKIVKNVLESRIADTSLHAIEVGRAFIAEMSGVNDDRHKAYMSFFKDDTAVNAINGKTMYQLIDDVKSTFSTVDIYGVIRLLEGTIGNPTNLVARVVEDYVRPAIATMKGSYSDTDIENIAKSMIDGAMAYRSRSVSIKVDNTGKAIKATLSPNTTANTFTSVKSDTGFYAYMINLEFPEGTDDVQKFKITNAYKANNHVVSAGEFGNNLSTTLIQFSHDLNLKDNFEKFFHKDYSKSAFKDYVEAMNTSFNPKNAKGESFLKLAYDEVLRNSDIDTFDKFSAKFAKVYGEMLIAEHGRIMPPSSPKAKKGGDGEKEFTVRVSRESANSYFESVNNAIEAIKVRASELKDTYSGMEEGKRSIFDIVVDNVDKIPPIITELKKGVYDSIALNPIVRVSDINTDAMNSVYKMLLSVSTMLNKASPISYQDINMKLASINESEFYSKMRQSLLDIDQFGYRLSKSPADLSRDNIDMIKHTIESNTIDKRELMVRTMMAGSSAYTVDYAAKRQSYFITAQVDPKIMAQHLLSGPKQNIKTIAIFAETDADGNQIIPQDMVDALALGGDPASGKLTVGMSKNQMITSRHLNRDQIIQLINVAGYDNIKGLLGSKDIDDAVKIIEDGIINKTFDFIVLTPQSFKGMNIEILKSMKNSPPNSGLIFAGDRKQLFAENAKGEFVHGLANGILDAATHAYNKTNADQKEASSQLESSVLGRSYLGTYLARYEDDYTKEILNSGELIDINTFFEDVHRKILKSATIDKKVIGLTGKVIGAELQEGRDHIIGKGAEYTKLKVPSLVMGTKDLGALVLKIKDIKDNVTASMLGTKMMNGKDISSDEIQQALDILVNNKVIKKFTNEDGSSAYTMAAVRYPMVGGTNFTVVKLKGFLDGLDGISIQLGVFKSMLGGDWDGDTAQLLQLDDAFFDRFLSDNTHLYGDDVYKALEQNLLEMRVSAELSKISAKTTSDDAVKDIGSIGPILAKIQKFKALLSYRFKMFDEGVLQGIANGAVFNSFNAPAEGVKYTTEIKSGERKEVVYESIVDNLGNSGIKSSARFLEDQSRFIILKKNIGGYDAFGSLGGTKAGDNDLVLVREVGEIRTYKRGEMYFSTKDSPDIPGFKSVIAASTDYSKIISFTDKNTDNTKDMETFDKHLLFMKDTVITSLDTLDRFWDGASTSRVKLEAVMTALGIDAAKGGANALEKLNEIQAASLISFNFTKDEVYVNNGKFAINDIAVQNLKRGVLSIAEYMKSNGAIKLNELEVMTKLTARQLPEGDDLSKMMETIDKVLDNFPVIADKIPNSLKGIMQVLYKLKQDNTQIGGATVIQKLKNSGRIDKNFSIEFKDYASNNGPKFKMLKAATAIDRLISNFGINSAIGSSVNEKAFLKQTIDLISTKDAFLKSDRSMMLSDVERILNTTYKGQIKPTKNSLDEDIGTLLKKAGVVLVQRTELDNTRASIERADVSKANKLRSWNNGLIGDQKIAFASSNDTAKNVTVETLVNKMSGIMLSTDSDIKEVDKAIANAILQSLDLASQTVVGLVSKGLNSNFLKSVESATKEGRLKVTEEMMEKYTPIPVLELSDTNKVNNILTAGVC